MESIKISVVLFLTLMNITSANAEFRDIGESGRIVKLGNPNYCAYRAVFREPNGGPGVIRIPLPQSSSARSTFTSLPAALHYRGEMDSDALDELIDMHYLSQDQAVHVLGHDSPENSVFLSAQLTLMETREGAMVLLDVLRLHVESSVRITSGIRLNNVRIEEECSSRRGRAILRRS